MKRFGGLAAAACCVVLASDCGGSTPPGPGPGDVVITIRATGPSPTEVIVSRGGRVTFTNSDTRPHAISSDPIQTHTDCPPVNDVGTLNRGRAGAPAC